MVGMGRWTWMGFKGIIMGAEIAEVTEVLASGRGILGG